MLGRDVVAQALATLPPQVRAEYDGLGPLSWCSVHTTSAVLMAVAAHVRQEPKALQAAVVRAGVARTVRSIWRVLLSLTSDEQLIKRAPLVYSKSYQLGRVESSLTAPGQATFAVRGWPGIPELDVEGLVNRIRVYKDLGYFKPDELETVIERITHGPAVDQAPKVLSAFVERYAR